MNFKNKKGAVELSLNLIIMLVIGLTVLGLIIGFVTGFLGEAGTGFLGQLGEDDKNKLEQIKNEPGNFAISPTSLKVKKNERAKIYVKVRNPTNVDFDFTSDGGELGSDPNEKLYIDVSKGRNAWRGFSKNLWTSNFFKRWGTRSLCFRGIC